MKCTCNDRQHQGWTGLWHNAYCRWYDHDRAGRRVRAVVWGWVADRLVTIGDRLRLWGAAPAGRS